MREPELVHQCMAVLVPEAESLREGDEERQGQAVPRVRRPGVVRPRNADEQPVQEGRPTRSTGASSASSFSRVSSMRDEKATAEPSAGVVSFHDSTTALLIW